MRIVDILSEDLVMPAVEGVDRDAVLGEVVRHVAKIKSEIEPSVALRVLVDRERCGSTGVGNGFAIPHAKLPQLRGMIACFARSARGVEFCSLDGKPAHLFLTLLAPEGQAGVHLKALARASRMFKDDGFRKRLLGADGDAKALYAIIAAEDARLSNRGE